MTVYLIDGYNVLHALARAEGRGRHRQVSGEWVEAERPRFLDRVASFMGGTPDRAITVFDSSDAELRNAESASGNVEVYFGSLSLSADAIIEKCAFVLRSEEDIVVVSSDSTVQQTVFARNVRRMSSRQFVMHLRDNEASIARRRPAEQRGSRIEDLVPAEVKRRLEKLRDGASKSSGEANGTDQTKRRME